MEAYTHTQTTLHTYTHIHGSISTHSHIRTRTNAHTQKSPAKKNSDEQSFFSTCSSPNSLPPAVNTIAQRDLQLLQK